MTTQPKPDRVTPEHLYLSRRAFIKGLITTAGATALAACVPGPKQAPTQTPTQAPTVTPTQPATQAAQATPTSEGQERVWPPVSAESDDRGDALTAEQSINTYNNFYEFSLSKEGVAPLAQEFVTSPWSVQVGGLVNKPLTFSMQTLLDLPQEERIYRMRCVEAWSMVIPWIGFPLARLLEQVEPTAEAKYVRFETLYDPDQMPGQKTSMFGWPYVEGLRLDEAMHSLTLLATGLYGKALRPQTGAPIRLVIPWKYGFKSIKSIVKIDLVAEMPTSLWMASSPNEYGFYANVNPNVSHPRWSQATERRIGELGRRETLMFNGYGEQVAHLYEGMDLRVWF